MAGNGTRGTVGGGMTVGRDTVIGKRFGGQTGDAEEEGERLLGEDMNGVEVEVGRCRKVGRSSSLSEGSVGARLSI